MEKARICAEKGGDFMKSKFHIAAGIAATLLMAAFFTSTVVVELFGSREAIATVKHLIVFPGVLILAPAIASTGATGFALSRHRHGRVVDKKKKRMPFIAANGILILLPSAVFLDRLASANVFDTFFYVVQAAELAAGATNLVLTGMNIRDGLRLKGRIAA